MKYKIAVSGAAQLTPCTKGAGELAKEIGREIARQGCILISGATTGVPDLSAQGTKEINGISIGFSPAVSELEHRKVYRLPLKYYDVVVYTGFDYAGRNLLMTRASDGVIVICGRMGTLNEFTIAFEDKKPIGVLEGTGGTADIIRNLIRKPHRKAGTIIYDTNPKTLIKKLIKAIKEEKSKKRSK